MTVNALKPSLGLNVVASPYLRDDGTPKTIAEILGKSKDEKSELQDFSEVLQGLVELKENSIILKTNSGEKRIISKEEKTDTLTLQSRSGISKDFLLRFLTEAFGNNHIYNGKNFSMITGKDVADFFHSVVGLDSGKHYWLGDRGLALYIDTTAEMIYIVNLDEKSRAYTL